MQGLRLRFEKNILECMWSADQAFVGHAACWVFRLALARHNTTLIGIYFGESQGRAKTAPICDLSLSDLGY